MKHVVAIVGLDGDGDDDFDNFDPADVLRSLNNIEFRLSMQAQTSSKQLVGMTTGAASILKELPEIPEQEQLDSRPAIERTADLAELAAVDARIASCQSMAAEVEEFETRIAKVEEHIKADELVALADLVVH